VDEAGERLREATARARRFRDHLRAAGVDRPELFEQTAERMQVRLHDLRASFVTIALANGRSEAWVADRTGHKSSVRINRYRRAARTAAELGLGDMLPLDVAVPELGGHGDGKGGGSNEQGDGSAGNATKQALGGVAERSKAAVLKTAVLARVPGVRIPSPPPAKSSTWLGEPEDPDGGAAGGVCTSICTSSVEASTLEQAIARITAALATAEDDVIPALVAERRALREELRNLSESRREPM
jgi:hypothetical protein